MMNMLTDAMVPSRTSTMALTIIPFVFLPLGNG